MSGLNPYGWDGLTAAKTGLNPYGWDGLTAAKTGCIWLPGAGGEGSLLGREERRTWVLLIESG
jgi:hypothetical protein